LIVLQFAPGEAEILTLAVRESWRRKGLGSVLVSHAIAAARERQASHVYLETAEGNAPARALYEARGFVIIGRRAAYYPRRGTEAETALVMKLDIELESANLQLPAAGV
jgi:ribosomal-protein-alanine N-acetyltransferase